MRYEIKYWNFDDDEKFIIICKTKNELIRELSNLCLDGRIEHMEITDLKRGGDF